MEQMTGYALSGIYNAESPEMMHARVQEACTMAEKMLQNSIEMVEYKGKTMGEWVKSVKKLQQLEDHLREATKKIGQLEAELSDAKNNHQHTIDIAERQKGQIDKLKKVIVRLNAERDAAVAFLKGQCWACKFSYCLFSEEPCASCFADRREKWQWRGVQKEE